SDKENFWGMAVA
nr:Chain D, 12-mer peptide [Escherichia coli]3TZX_C Chain C, 12-mer peptide [Escherichia coli]3TZX_D Chain D, 12-mer peptide [Escherichia coli]3TZY_C Chain C, 12-mer peptide [Escherichia coli]3TZY_D Chain D, 12-mer peptide [Escherichia coli]3TZZ_C Chain C, 12-mer peptide [Escherichia coli]